MKAIWKPIAVFYGVTLFACILVSILMKSFGGFGGPFVAVGAVLAMWTPALGRFVAVKTVDRGWKSPLPLRLRMLGWPSFFWPLGIAITIYGAAYFVALMIGMTSWEPVWESPYKIVVNLVINIPIIIVIGGFGSVGEELGWRGYLQPKLDEAGVRYSIVWVAILWSVFHLPLMILAGYQENVGLAILFSLFSITCIADSAIWTWLSYKNKSLWPAVWFHTFHNMASQWLFPRFFSEPDNELILGEDGVLPTLSHVAAVLILLILAKQIVPIDKKGNQ